MFFCQCEVLSYLPRCYNVEKHRYYSVILEIIELNFHIYLQ